MLLVHGAVMCAGRGGDTNSRVWALVGDGAFLLMRVDDQ
jgi:hypothetical protein